MSCERHGVTISVITWNVMHWFGYTCCECGELIAPGRECSCGWRCGEILQRIRSWVEHGTDLIYLQEVSQHLLDELYEVCAAKGYTVISSIYHRELMGVAMLLSGRFRIQNGAAFPAAEQRPRPGGPQGLLQAELPTLGRVVHTPWLPCGKCEGREMP